MGLDKNGNEEEMEEHRKRRIHLVFTRKMEERRLFMEELKSLRKQRTLRYLNDIKRLVGPKWSQTLSVNQIKALDDVDVSIYQDLLEGRPTRTLKILRILGVIPRPRKSELMVCIYEGKDDAKVMFAQLYNIMFDLQFDTRKPKYCLNERLILTSIYYIGLNQIIEKLREIFKPDVVEDPPKRKPKPKRQPPVASPYLERMTAVQYQPPVPKRTQPAPLPNLDVINTEPYEDKPEIEKKEIPPVPLQPPKRKIPTYVCDELAGIINIEPRTGAVSNVTPKNYLHNAQHILRRRIKCSRSFIGGDKKKNFGMSSTRPVKKKKPIAPKQNLCNAQYIIQGVFSINNRPFYILGQVCIMQPEGDLIHGGHRMLEDGKYINIHNGMKGHYPKKIDVPCDCMSQYQDSIMRYVQNTKCHCGHFYDFGHEIGSYPSDEIQYFEKPSCIRQVTFNYPAVYEMDQKNIQITKDFKKLWETDSILHDEKYEDEEEKEDKPKKKKIKKKLSSNCLGDNPRIEDYLKCALRHMQKYNIATRLPDIYQAPELREWMRRRIYGPLTTQQKQLLLNRTSIHWTILGSLESKGYGRVFTEQKSIFMGLSDWGNQPMLSKEFKKFSREYKRKTYISQARLNNLWWTTMCQTQLPDKHFREIYFAYLISRYEDLKLIHPYNSREAKERQLIMSVNRYCCPPDGIENLDL